MPKLGNNGNLFVRKSLPLLIGRYEVFDQPLIFVEFLLPRFPFSYRKKLEDGNEEGDCRPNGTNAQARRQPM